MTRNGQKYYLSGICFNIFPWLWQFGWGKPTHNGMLVDAMEYGHLWLALGPIALTYDKIQ